MLMEMTPSEKQLLLELLARELSDLGPEIHHTDDRAFRQELKDRKVLVRQLLERFEPVESV